MAVGEDLGPSGPPTRTYDVAPHAEAPDFDDSGWRRLAPPELELRLGAGLLSANWYRTSVTIPGRLGDLDPTGATIVFEVVIDDYAEVWVNGELPKALGDTGGNVASGFNAPNRVVLTRDARPGQRFHLAVFGINGPLSASPRNYIWVRSATLDVYARRAGAGRRAGPAGDPPPRSPRSTPSSIRDRPRTHRHRVRVHRRPGVDRRGAAVQRPEHEHDLPLVARGPRHRVPHEERLLRHRHRPLPPARLERPRRRRPTGCSPSASTASGGSSRVNPHGDLTVLADRYQGKRLNSPNDLVFRSDGDPVLHRPAVRAPRTSTTTRARVALQRRLPRLRTARSRC